MTAIVKNGSGADACDSPEPAAQSVVDTTNVMTAQIRLLKEQGLDAKCDGVVDLAFSATQIQVKPGECVIYRVQASNQGVDEVTNVIMNDSTPAFDLRRHQGNAGLHSRPGHHAGQWRHRSRDLQRGRAQAGRQGHDAVQRQAGRLTVLSRSPGRKPWHPTRGGSRRSRLVISTTLIPKD